MATPPSNTKLWSTTPASNGSGSTPIYWPEGQAPSTVNDCARQMMADLRYYLQDAEWFCWGETSLSRASGASFKVNGVDATSRYLAQRRIKIYDTSTMYGTIISSSYSAPDTTVTISVDAGSLTNSFSNIALSILSPTNTAIPSTQSADDSFPCFGRLTLTTATPVTTADVTAATTLYFTPYGGNALALYDGSSAWTIFNISELSIAVPSTNNTMYDVWVYNNSGVPTLEVLAWTNTTTRATALTKQDGVYVKTGATTRRYVGSFCTTGTVGQTEDSVANRFVWNYYNRVQRQMYAIDTTDSWTYSTATIRQANAATTNQVNFVIGVSEDMVLATVSHCRKQATNTGNQFAGVGLDSTTAFATNSLIGVAGSTGGTDGTLRFLAGSYNGYPGIGKHYLAWLEKGDGNTTTTWYGDNAAVQQTGIQAQLLG